MGSAELVSGGQMVELCSLDCRRTRQATEEDQRQSEQNSERHGQLVRGRRNVVVVWHCWQFGPNLPA
jgi:hypothetical protein